MQVTHDRFIVDKDGDYPYIERAFKSYVYRPGIRILYQSGTQRDMRRSN